ncbi:MAG: DNA mismatch repair protein MutS [Spirochaetaceae bacterium]|nr:DNA mismatch repair protein MutS [Spirochaetaceae bacterium]
MDFGAILDAWEKQSAKEAKEAKKINSQRPSSKKKNADFIEKQSLREKEKNTPKESHVVSPKKEKQVNPMDMWLRRYGVVDKDKMFEENEKKSLYLDRNQLRSLPWEAKIDLHGLTSDEAWESLDIFVGNCQRRGFRKILIVHGKGNHSQDEPVLQGVVRRFIERDYRLGESGHPDRQEGGKGATWVIIRPSVQ